MEDEIFVMISTQSMNALKGIGDTYAQVSGYRINQAKSTIFGINVNRLLEMKYKKFDLTPWMKKVRYLGVYVSLPLTNSGLKQENLNLLLQQIEQQFEKW